MSSSLAGVTAVASYQDFKQSDIHLLGSDAPMSVKEIPDLESGERIPMNDYMQGQIFEKQNFNFESLLGSVLSMLAIFFGKWLVNFSDVCWIKSVSRLKKWRRKDKHP